MRHQSPASDRCGASLKDGRTTPPSASLSADADRQRTFTASAPIDTIEANRSEQPARSVRDSILCVLPYRMLSTPMRRVTAEQPVSIADLRSLAPGRFRDMIKAVVDLRRGVMLIDADMHADQEAALLAEGSRQDDLWGLNLYPHIDGVDWLEFDSMINLRPSFGNRSRGVDDAATREAIVGLVSKLVQR